MLDDLGIYWSVLLYGNVAVLKAKKLAERTCPEELTQFETHQYLGLLYPVVTVP